MVSKACHEIPPTFLVQFTPEALLTSKMDVRHVSLGDISSDPRGVDSLEILKSTPAIAWSESQAGGPNPVERCSGLVS